MTVFAPDKDSAPDVSGLHFIWAEKVYATVYPEDENVNNKYSSNPFASFWEVWPGVLTMCDALLSSKGFDTLMSYPTDTFKVDLLLVDVTIGPCWAGFMHKFKYPPVVGLTAFAVPGHVYEYMDGHRQPAYIPHQMVEYSDNMNFMERFTNFYMHVVEHL